MEPESLRLTGSDGLELRLLKWSDEGTPAILIHGFGNEAHIWDDFAPALAPYYQVWALDLRGHGESDWDSESRYAYENHLADLEVIVETLGFERLVLVGHSLGGRVSIRYSGKHSDKVAGLVIVDSAPELDARGTTRISLDVQEHRDPSFESIAQYENYLSTSYPHATPTAIRRMAEHGLKKREDGRYALKMDISFRSRAAGDFDRDAYARYEEETTTALWKDLEAIQCPTLVVRGAASDIMSAEVADRMVDETLPDGTLAIVPQAGHSVMTDNPREFQECVSRFMLGE